jgi:hypothetical protein
MTSVLCFAIQFVSAQEIYGTQIDELRTQKEQVEPYEKKQLKREILAIEKKLQSGALSEAEAQSLKEQAARKHALNIEDKYDIIDRKIEIIKRRIALLERNKGDSSLTEIPKGEGKRSVGIQIRVDDEPLHLLGKRTTELPYDRRTYSDMVLALGLNNALQPGQSLNDSDFELAGSRFFEIGWAWRTRVFRNSNWLRLHYGFSFHFNGLQLQDNQYFEVENGQTVPKVFDAELNKSKFRTDNLVFPVHFELGPSRYKEYSNRFRYSLHNKFRFGFGGYAGLNMGSRQKLKYIQDGKRAKDKYKASYNTSAFVYGLSSYIGVEGVLLYAKYDISPIFYQNGEELRNMSLGLRFDL